MPTSSTRSLNTFFLVMINVSAIFTIKNWPITAEYGFSSLFYFLVSALFFFFPISLISAELATGWPKRGGIYVWVREAFGHRMGFLAVWLLWVENIIWYPTILSFIAGTIAFAIDPNLASNTTYMFFLVLGTFWGITLLNLLGMKASGWISSLGVIFGTLIPALAVIFLGMTWIFQGNPLHIGFTFNDFMPTLSSPKHLALLVGALLGFVGMEMSSVHAKEVKNPQRTYPISIFISALIIIILSILGTLAIAIIIPQKEINLVSGIMAAISRFFDFYHLNWAIPFIAFLIAFGAFGTVSTWVVGPSKGLLAAAQDGDFPPLLHRINRKNMPVALLLLQAIIVSILAAIFLLMPNVSSAFWILSNLTIQLYLIMYLFMLMSAIILRWKKPDVPRPYKIPGGNWGLYLTSGIGICGALFAFIIGFFPPEQLETGSLLFYESFLICGIILFCAAPFVILLFKKPSWDEPIPFQDDNRAE